MSKSIYQNELENLEQSKQFLSRNEYSKMELQLEFKKLLENYEELIDQVKIITKISDRLQNKLNNTNEKLELLNSELNQKNIQLRDTINALAEAKIGRKAATIILFFTISIFLVSEAFIEPRIDDMVVYFWGNTDSVNPFYLSIFIKLILALSIKPAESLVERTLLKREQKKHLKVVSE